LPIRERAIFSKVRFLTGALITGGLWPPRRSTLRAALQRFEKEPTTFARLSRLTARRIAAVDPAPGMVLQFFSMSSPALANGRLPYAHYIDMTMALVRRSWPDWAPFDCEARYQEWIALEGASYRGAERVFTFSEATRRSVIADYGARPERVVTVGAAGHYEAAASGERAYGNRTIVFNGSDFERKGGERVLAAFRLVRERFPDATLTIVAAGVPASPGVTVSGNLGRPALFALFDRTDIVLAPTRLDILPGFVLEAMSRGVVPILSDAASMDEIVTSGSDGYIASPPTPELLAEDVAKLFSDDARLRAFGDAARARVVRDWNWDAVADAMVASLKNTTGAWLIDGTGALLPEGALPDAANPR
jgi:glycogen(starch) synthase